MRIFEQNVSGDIGCFREDMPRAISIKKKKHRKLQVDFVKSQLTYWQKKKKWSSRQLTYRQLKID